MSNSLVKKFFKESTSMNTKENTSKCLMKECDMCSAKGKCFVKQELSEFYDFIKEGGVVDEEK